MDSECTGSRNEHGSSISGDGTKTGDRQSDAVFASLDRQADSLMHSSALSNARWIAVSRVVSIGVQLLALAWLSRLLTPADYGLVAMAMVVVNLANLVRDMGATQALIQRDSLNQETILTSFWFTMAIGSVLGVAVAVFAPLAALAFEAPAVTGILLLLAMTFPVLGSTTVHQALLERESRFPLLARVEAVAAVSGLMAGLIAAYLGAGAYSLVLNSLVQAVVSSLQLWLASPLQPRWLWNRQELRSIRQFSDYLVGFNIVNYFCRNADNMIIGRFLGADSLGLYSLAYKIMLFPLANLTFVAARALFPVMSRQQEAPEAIAALLIRTLAVVAFITAPMMAGLTVLREPFIEVLLGRKWLPMSDVLVWLAPVGFLGSLMSTTGAVFMARGRTDILFKLGIASLALHLAGFIIGLQWGVAGVAAGFFFVNLIEFFPVFYIVFRVLERGMSPFFRSILPSIGLTGAMVFTVLACREALPLHNEPALVQLAVLTLAGAAAYGVLAWMFAREMVQDFVRLFRRS